MMVDGRAMEDRGRTTMAVETEVARRLFTRSEYHRMAEVGILKQSDRVELIRGEIVTLSPPGRRHSAFVDNLNELLVLRLGGRALVRVQNPVVLDEYSEPQPDLVLLRRRAVPYKDADATADDVLLLIEVSDSSIRYDRTTKLRLYAEAGVPEYWIVDCTAETVEVYRSPGARGYGDVAVVSGTASVSPRAVADLVLALSEIFA
jgi:Uma2 family endonuclease